MKTAYFERFTLDLPETAVGDCSHQGACDSDVAHWAPWIARPADLTPEKLSAELRDYGAWDEQEISDDAANWRRIIWIAAGNIRDDEAESRKLAEANAAAVKHAYPKGRWT